MTPRLGHAFGQCSDAFGRGGVGTEPRCAGHRDGRYDEHELTAGGREMGVRSLGTAIGRIEGGLARIDPIGLGRLGDGYCAEGPLMSVGEHHQIYAAQPGCRGGKGCLVSGPVVARRRGVA